MLKLQKFKAFLPFFTLFFLLIFCLSACSPSIPKKVEAKTENEFLLNTLVSITYYEDADAGAVKEALALCKDYELIFSRTAADSELSRLNESGSMTVSADLLNVLRIALDYCEKTDGAFDITMGALSSLYDFSGSDPHVPAPDDLRSALSHVDYQKIQIDGSTVTLGDRAAVVDLGAVAKGYTALVLTRMLADAGVESALLDLGGNIQAIGENPEGRPWGVAVQDPFGEGYLGVLSVTDRAVVTSGGYERNFEQNGVIYHHILDPDTAAPADTGLCAVTVVGENGLTCDALSTALYVMGKDAALDFWRSREDFECILVEPNGAVTVTEGLQDCFRAHVDAVTVAERG